MQKPIVWLMSLLLVTAGTTACYDGAEVMEPPVMALEVFKHDVELYGVSFTVSITNWDGVASIVYEAIACADPALCVATPFLQASRKADRVTQPFVWTAAECDAVLIFHVKLSDGQEEEAYHTTCSR
jgi:hypothetical protein